ncbi:MAG TPA: AMP-binding protein, partial [Kineosporiaceae bacterium]|nr:AMP-binding protein [Kineosporiaceae bacterium]
MTATTATETGATGAAQLSYARGPADVPLLEETIGVNFDRTVDAHDDRDALVEFATSRRWTYGQLRDDVDALALGLLRLGIARGDRVGIWAPNCAEWTQLQYATARIGAILVCINPAYRAQELEYVLVQSGVRLLVAARSFKTADYAAMIDDVRPRCPLLEHVVLIDSEQWRALPDRDGDPADLAARQACLDPRDPINIQYTSGTTGHPKGATLTHHNILNNAFFIGEVCGYTEADRICVPVPLFHTFGMVIDNLGATTHGACLVYPAPSF